MQALLLICHGSRMKQGCVEAKRFVEQCIEQVDVPIKEICFLELSDPSISEGFQACIQQGATKISVIPVLLLTANHAKMDIPEELAILQREYPLVEVTYGRPFGVHDSLSDLLWEKITEKTSSLRDNAQVLLIGRGSTDPDVKRDLEAIALQLQKKYSLPSIEACFLTGSKPSFEDALAKIHPDTDQVIAVPYLLFSGLLLNGIRKTMKHYEEQNHKEIIVCEALGYHPLLKEVLLTRIDETLHPAKENVYVSDSY